MKHKVFKRLVIEFLDFFFPPSELWREIHNWDKKDVVRECKRSKKSVHNSTSLFCYKDPKIKEMIWSIKFRGQRHFTKIFGELLWSELKNSSGTLIPIPIHPKRKRERGFNQCEWLCEEIKKHDIDNKLEYRLGVLRRDVYKEKQSWNGKNDRKNNIKGVFSINEKIQGNVFLIDDVITTGATVEEAQRILLAAGAKRVLIYTIAH